MKVMDSLRFNMNYGNGFNCETLGMHNNVLYNKQVNKNE